MPVATGTKKNGAAKSPQRQSMKAPPSPRAGASREEEAEVLSERRQMREEHERGQAAGAPTPVQTRRARATPAETGKQQEHQEKLEAQKQQGGMKQFLLLAGSHVDEAGRVVEFRRDQDMIVESIHDLDVMFMNKFRRLQGETLPGRDFTPAWDREGLGDDPMHKQHPFGRATQFSQDTDEKAVQERMQRGRQQATERGEEVPEGAEEEEDTEEAASAQEEESEKVESPLGEDVSDEFPDAKGADLVVLVDDDDRYHVADKEKPAKALNKEPLKKKDLPKFLKTQIRG